MSKDVMKPGSIQINFDEKGGVSIKFTGEVNPRRMVTLPYHMRRAFADHLRANRTLAKPVAPPAQEASKAPATPVAPKPLSIKDQLESRKAASIVAPVATSPSNPASP